MFQTQEQNGVVFLTASNIPARHAFTTRFGGVSTGPLASLNLGENRGDEPENVRENYRRLALAVGIDTRRMAYTQQVHENTVRVVTEADRRELFTPLDYTADGLVTNQRDLPLIIFTADCIPVLLCDPENGVVGAVHCGWRPTAADIQGEAVRKMCALGAKPASIRAAIGPGIGPCCFETGPEVPEALSALLSGDTDGLVRPHRDTPGKRMVDLPGVVARRFLQLGLAEANIAVSEECTMCSHEKFWSHRHTGGVRGSQAALIVL